MRRVHFQEDVVHYFEKGRCSAVMMTIGRLQTRIDFIDDHVLMRLTKYILFGEVRNVLQIADKSSLSFSSKG